jgi:hypothetical protein
VYNHRSDAKALVADTLLETKIPHLTCIFKPWLALQMAITL